MVIAEINEKPGAYAALDVTVALDAYFVMRAMPDLAIRIDADAATADVPADVVPSNGSVASMATRAAIGKIATQQSDWRLTIADCTPSALKCTLSKRLVTVSRVTVPGLVIPGVKRKQSGKFVPVCLNDLGDAPFNVMLPLTMLKLHVEPDRVRATPTGTCVTATTTPTAMAGTSVTAAAAAPPSPSVFGATLIGKRFTDDGITFEVHAFARDDEHQTSVGYYDDISRYPDGIDGDLEKCEWPSYNEVRAWVLGIELTEEEDDDMEGDGVFDEDDEIDEEAANIIRAQVAAIESTATADINNDSFLGTPPGRDPIGHSQAPFH